MIAHFFPLVKGVFFAPSPSSRLRGMAGEDADMVGGKAAYLRARAWTW